MLRTVSESGQDADIWSETATMLSFSPASFEVALTVMRKTVKLTTPWGCCYQIFGLLFQYVLLLSMIQLLFVNAPAHITDTFQSNTGKTMVSIDADVTVPDVDKIPIYLISPRLFSSEEMIRAANELATVYKIGYRLEVLS